jgi:hypothetical protein
MKSESCQPLRTEKSENSSLFVQITKSVMDCPAQKCSPSMRKPRLIFCNAQLHQL